MRRCHVTATYLHTAHLELANNLDGYLAWHLALEVPSSVYVAEGTVSHLLQKIPLLQTGVLGEFRLACSLLGYQLGNVTLVDALALALWDSMLDTLVGLGVVGGDVTGLRSAVRCVVAWLD